MQSDSDSSTPSKDSGCMTQSMIEMIEIIEHTIDIEMEKDASPSHLANASVIALCRVLGGGVFYLPRAASLKKSMRDCEMFKDHRAGVSVHEILKKYKISSQAFYKIIGQQRLASRQQYSPGGQKN